MRRGRVVGCRALLLGVPNGPLSLVISSATTPRSVTDSTVRNTAPTALERESLRAISLPSASEAP
jgi:hypothetical protein